MSKAIQVTIFLLYIFILLVTFAIFYIGLILFMGGTSVMLPAYVRTIYLLSPFVVYPLAYRFNIKLYLVHIAYLVVISTIGLIALNVIDNPKHYCSSVGNPFQKTFPEDALASTVLILPFLFALRGVIGYYKPAWFDKDSSKPARKYIYITLLLLLPAIFVMVTYGAIAFGCQDS